MATYKIKGQRYLRKYTEQGTSPVYAASAQAQKIVDTLCEVPWERTGVDSAQMTYHTDEIVDDERKISGLDRNVEIRDNFDAALFCAGHSGGMHRAYANAAVYRYTMPDDAIGKTLVSLAARVTSDPYNSEGARLHIFTNSTGELPMNCRILRGENASGEIVADGTTVAAVARRTEKLVGKETYWYPTTETCTLSPVDSSTSTPGLAIQKYLFLVVALESYSTVRGNWLEGCSFIDNSVNIEVETDAAIAGLSETDLNDLRGISEDTPSDIPIHIVANADLKGKLWLQAVSCETKRILKKWSFDCEFFYGQNEKTVIVPNLYGDQELLAHYGGIFFEAWVGGEHYDATNLYGCSNTTGLQDGAFEIELTPTHPVFARIRLEDGRNDRKTIFGIDSGNVVSTEGESALSGGTRNHVRIVPYLMSSDRIDTSPTDRQYVECLNWLPTSVVAEFDVDANMRPYITEADFIRDGKFDIHWDKFATTDFSENGSVVEHVGDITAVKYRIILGVDGPAGAASTSDTETVVRAYSTLVERRFEQFGARTIPTQLALAEGGVLSGSRPTFMWRLDELTGVNNLTRSTTLFGCSYTAFQLQIKVADENETLVYDSGLKRAPAKNASGFFVWKIPPQVARDLEAEFGTTGNWKWRVAMYNAKFKPISRENHNGWSDYAMFSTTAS